ncbi:hypothetical protein [Photobacterium carnosum]|uniref:hypothetical protein n=1 Tax=Photobacterium carnosum TaxID=2023717 RepID=UPI001E3D61FF|nr:hypothetical protein [Photobacterium carnosum]MCD9498856.1 hypothetical protein [Photobacterium carnosum]
MTNQQNNEKDSEKTLNHQFTDDDRIKALRSDNHGKRGKRGKRGKGRATFFKEMIQSVTNTDEIQQLYNSAVQGKFGEDAQFKFILQATELGYRQALLDYKLELDIEKHQAIAGIKNDVDDQLISRLIARLSKDMSSDEVKNMIREVRSEQVR